MPPLAVLHSLRVTLAACVLYRNWTQDCPLDILPGAACSNLAVWDAPARLRVLHIAYCPPTLTCRSKRAARYHAAAEPPACLCHADSLPISLADVHCFVASCFSPTTLCLSELSLRGVEPIDPSPWHAFERLQELSADVSISPIAMPTPFEVTDQECAMRALGILPPA